MMRIVLIISAIHLMILHSAFGQNVEFSLKKLEEIASKLPSKYLVKRDTIMPCPDICRNKSIVVGLNEKRQVSHFGISLFSKETKEIINRPVCDFVERLLLELALTKDKNSVIAMLDRNKIILRRNGVIFGEGFVNSIDAILQEIDVPVQFMLIKDEDSYTVVWEYGDDDMLAINFPLNRELILGANKKESDNLLYDLLKDNNCMNVAEIKERMFEDGTLTSTDDTVFICKGDTFMFKGINTDSYYQKTDNGFKLIYDKKFPKESLSNLILGYDANKTLKILVKHSMYGNFSPEYEMKFIDFMCFFKNDFDIYAASYLKEPGELKSTIVFQNRQYNYINLLIINTSDESIFDKNGVMTASFYSNIPQHNIKSLFGDFANNN